MERPVVATILGVLNLMLGLWGICGAAMGLGMYVFVASLGADANLPDNSPLAALAQMQGGLYTPAAMFGMAISTLLALLYVGSGIGLLLTRAWGRSLGLAVSGLCMVYFVVFDVIVTILNQDRMLDMMNARSQVRMPAEMGIVFVVMGILGASIFHLLYPLLQMFFLTRPNVKQAFGAGQ